MSSAHSSTLLEIIHAQARRSPDATAVRMEDRTLSFASLDLRASQLAGRLRIAGVRPEHRVGIYAERSLEMVVMLLAVWKAGAAYVPLDPNYPIERLAFISADADCRIILTQPGLADQCRRFGGETIIVDEDEATADGIDEPLDLVRPGNALAYIIYTSGSTGQPKGVMIEDSALLNHMLWMQGRFPLVPQDRVLQKTAFGFDASVWEFWAPLMAGAELVMARPGGQRDSAYLADALNKFGITRLQLVPSMLEALLDEDGFASLPALSHVFCGGEALLSEIVRCFSRRSSAQLVNLYGPSEATIDASYWICDPGEAAMITPIGQPIAGTSLHILDDDLNPVAPGDAGELYIGGVGLGRGYAGQPIRTAESFLPNPFGNGRIYKTGDRARRRYDGALEFLGRFDHQVKLRGHRVELSEIDVMLRSDSAVEQAVTILSGDKLTAFIVGNANEGIEVRLKTGLARTLPDYMIPGSIIVLAGMPLMPNGKIDRIALSKIAAAVCPGEILAPRDETEAALASICAGLLGRAVSVDENILDAGMNSLQATRFVARVRKTFRIEMPLASLFVSPSIEQLAELVRAGGLAHDEVTIARRDPLQPAPLSFAQERVWFVQQLVPDNLAYAFRTVIRLYGALDVAALECTLSEIVRRHEIFRTSFPLDGQRPVQRVHPPFDVTLPVVDLSGDPASSRQTADTLLACEFRRGFELSRLPLIRWTLIRLHDDEHMLAQIEHHLVHDGWSFNIYLRELKEIYGAFATGRSSPLPELALQFGDFAAWQRDWMVRSGVGERQLQYWRKALLGAPPRLDLDIARPRPPEPSFRGSLHRLKIPPATARSLRALCRESGVTLFMGMLGVFKLLLHRHSGCHDIVVGTGVANRRWAESEEVMGMILNNLVLRTSFENDPSFQDVLARVRQTTLEAYAHQDVPFEDVVQALQPQRDLRYNPLTQVMFSFHDAPLPHLDVAGLRLEVTDLMDNGSAKFDLSLIVIPHQEQATGLGSGGTEEAITVIWEFNTDLFDRPDIEALAAEYQSLLGELSLFPQTTLSALSGPSSRALLLRGPEGATPQALAEAVAALGAVHPACRSANGVPPTLHVDDLEDVPAGSRAQHAAALVAKDVGSDFDLVVQPRLRARWIRQDQETHLLSLVLHRSASNDGCDPDALFGELAGCNALPTDHVGMDACRIWWRTRLELGCLPIGLATDHPRPAALSGDTAELAVGLGVDTLEALERISGAAGATPFETVLALFAILLNRYGAQDGSMIALPRHSRSDRDRGAPFSLTPDLTILRQAVDRDGSFNGLLRAMSADLRETLHHASLPFATMAALAGTRHDAGHHPLAQVALSLLRPEGLPARLGDWDIAGGEPPLPDTALDLHWSMTLTGNAPQVSVRYSTELFEAASVRRMIHSFGVLVAAVAHDATAPVGKLDILPHDERKAALAALQAPWAAGSVGIPAHRRFSLQVERDRDAVAVVHDGIATSYGELERRADQLAARLRELGIGPGSLVPIYCPRSLRMVIAVLAVAKAGGAYVPVDIGCPRDRIDYILQDAGAEVILSESSLAAMLPDTRATIVCLDIEAHARPHGAPASATPAAAVASSDLAYVIYTSGTTGWPKGVMVEHGNLSNFIGWFVREYDLGPGRDIVVHSPLSFDLTVSTLWGPLVSGGTAVLFPEGDIETLMESFRRIGSVHLVKLTPAHLDMLRDTLTPTQRRLLAKVLIVAGEVFPVASAAFWREAAPETRLVNFYGPTETTVGCTVHDITSPPMTRRRLPIGKPMADARIVILDEAGQLVPDGVIGEIHIAGPGVSRGYLNKPEHDRSRFVACSMVPRVRLYRSGDYGRFLADGSIEYAGRIDGQVKLRGFRIELGEIEGALLRLPGIADVAVVLEGTEAERALAAWVVASAGSGLTAQTVLLAAAAWLPSYMRPASVTFVAAFPLTPNGKLDHKALLAMRTAPSVTTLQHLVETQTERRVGSVWSGLLGTKQLASEQDFFASGGNSLLAVRMVARLRDEFAVELSIRSVFEHATIRSLARHIDTLEWLGRSESTVQALSHEEFQL